jgi:hypothetical protein
MKKSIDFYLKENSYSKRYKELLFTIMATEKIEFWQWPWQWQ